MMWILVIAGIVLFLLGGVLLWSGRRTQKLVNLMKQAVPTPAERINDAFPGELVAVHGVARTERPLKSEHEGTPCIYYSSWVERDYETTEYTAATKDQPARRTTRRVTETISSNTQSTAFFIEDETGRARVIPDDAEFDARQTLNRFEPAGNGSGGSFSIGAFSLSLGDGDRTLGYRYRESIIPVDAPVYVLGVVSDSGEIGKPQSKQQNAALIVSHRTEEALREDWQQSARWQAYGSIGSVAAGCMLLISAFIAALI